MSALLSDPSDVKEGLLVHVGLKTVFPFLVRGGGCFSRETVIQTTSSPAEKARDKEDHWMHLRLLHLNKGLVEITSGVVSHQCLLTSGLESKMRSLASLIRLFSDLNEKCWYNLSDGEEDEFEIQDDNSYPVRDDFEDEVPFDEDEDKDSEKRSVIIKQLSATGTPGSHEGEENAEKARDKEDHWMHMRLLHLNKGLVEVVRRSLDARATSNASQQGSGKVGKWKINFLSTQKNYRKGSPINNGKNRYWLAGSEGKLVMRRGGKHMVTAVHVKTEGGTCDEEFKLIQMGTSS
ncbi:hypothetical protein L2E82_47657 [Cichorium intybus]|uniref:Uncharacterized protein n=1 Tax=Cichorium intybus TaxID=13427 RepID=A0ACB8YVD1_CICIN|nr:hypothetical protein L2E82_47657 [Cichorium intybus]